MKRSNHHLLTAYLGALAGIMFILTLDWMTDHNATTTGVVIMYALIISAFTVTTASLILVIKARREEHNA